MHPSVHCSAIYSSQDTGTTSVSIDRRMDKEDVVYIHNGILLSHKNAWNNAIYSNMDGPRDYQVSQNKTNIIYHLHVESKTWHKWPYLWNRNSLTDIENKVVIAKGQGMGEGLEFGISRYKLIYRMNNFLLYSTGNYIQCPVIMKMNMKKNVYITESLCCTVAINNM